LHPIIWGGGGRGGCNISLSLILLSFVLFLWGFVAWGGVWGGGGLEFLVGLKFY